MSFVGNSVYQIHKMKMYTRSTNDISIDAHGLCVVEDRFNGKLAFGKEIRNQVGVGPHIQIPVIEIINICHIDLERKLKALLIKV